MIKKAKNTVDDLKDEITDLKISDIRKDILAMNKSFGEKLDTLIEHVSRTNGSVAKVTERNFYLEQKFSEHCIISQSILDKSEERLKLVETIEKETRLVRWIGSHPKSLLIPLFVLVILSGGEAATRLIDWLIKSFV